MTIINEMMADTNNPPQAGNPFILPPNSAVTKLTDLINLDAFFSVDYSEVAPIPVAELHIPLGPKNHQEPVPYDTLPPRRPGTYVVLANGKFYAYKVGPVRPSGNHLLKFNHPLPPILKEGLVVYNKDYYFVTVEDLKRGIIRTSRKIKLKRGTITYDDFIIGTTASNKKPNTQATAIEDGSGGILTATGGPAEAPSWQGKDGEALSVEALLSVQSGGSDIEANLPSAGLDELKAADLAFQDQVRALFGDSNPETWENG